VVAAVVLNRAFNANQRGGGLLIIPTQLCRGALAQVAISAPWRFALKIAFMLLFNGNAEMLGVLVQLQVEWVIRRGQTEWKSSTVQPALKIAPRPWAGSASPHSLSAAPTKACIC
jgi:hypothetical protein